MTFAETNKILIFLSELRQRSIGRVMCAKVYLVPYKRFTVTLSVFKARTHCHK